MSDVKLPPVIESFDDGTNFHGAVKGFYPQFVGGLLFSTVKEVTGRLEPCIALHSIHNALAFSDALRRKITSTDDN